MRRENFIKISFVVKIFNILKNMIRVLIIDIGYLQSIASIDIT